MEVYFPDACSVIAFFQKEPGFEKVRELLEKSDAGQCTLYINKINALEIYYGLYREDGPSVAGRFLDEMTQLPVEIIDNIDDMLFLEAGRLKATYKISLADSIALAGAKIRDAYLVTSDHHEFDIIDRKKELKFYWIR
jgi:predicted nucleic acid-binding protein